MHSAGLQDAVSSFGVIVELNKGQLVAAGIVAALPGTESSGRQANELASHPRRRFESDRGMADGKSTKCATPGAGARHVLHG
jgi:hypothetical protein